MPSLESQGMVPGMALGNHSFNSNATSPLNLPDQLIYCMGNGQIAQVGAVGLPASESQASESQLPRCAFCGSIGFVKTMIAQ
jgi:hypothetical protein